MEIHKLVEFLQDLAASCRDQVPDAALATWAEIMQPWKFSDDEWVELKRRLAKYHRGGPLRLPEILDVAQDLREEAERRRNMEHLQKLMEGSGGGPQSET